MPGSPARLVGVQFGLADEPTLPVLDVAPGVLALAPGAVCVPLLVWTVGVLMIGLGICTGAAVPAAWPVAPVGPTCAPGATAPAGPVIVPGVPAGCAAVVAAPAPTVEFPVVDGVMAVPGDVPWAAPAAPAPCAAAMHAERANVPKINGIRIIPRVIDGGIYDVWMAAGGATTMEIASCSPAALLP